MGVIYSLEVYHFEGDYWNTIGFFTSREEALKMQYKLEKSNDLFYSIFSKELCMYN